MISPTKIQKMYTKTYDLIMRQLAGLTHVDSLRQFPSGGNCLNWTLGHITVSRLNVLAMLGDNTSLWDWTEARRYIPGSPPIINEQDAIHFDTIRAILVQSQQRLHFVLGALSLDALEQPVGSSTVGDELITYSLHEAYHTGQIELCRRLVPHVEPVNYDLD